MADPMMDLRLLVEKAPDADLLREVIALLSAADGRTLKVNELQDWTRESRTFISLAIDRAEREGWIAPWLGGLQFAPGRAGDSEWQPAFGPTAPSEPSNRAESRTGSQILHRLDAEASSPGTGTDPACLH